MLSFILVKKVNEKTPIVNSKDANN